LIPTEELISDEMSEKIVEAAEQIAIKDGAHTVNVRKILSALGITWIGIIGYVVCGMLKKRRK